MSTTVRYPRILVQRLTPVERDFIKNLRACLADPARARVALLYCVPRVELLLPPVLPCLCLREWLGRVPRCLAVVRRDAVGGRWW